MIVSGKHGFIFVHIFRTGGKSLTRALQPYGDEEIEGYIHRHMTALEIRELLGEQFWNESHSFSIVRNPWDRVLSQYLFHIQSKKEFLGRHGQEPTKDFRRTARRMRRFRHFEAFLNWFARNEKLNDWTRHKLTQTDFLFCDKGNLLVDQVLRFENLETELPELESSLGIELDLPRINTHPHLHYSEYYNYTTQRIVADTCRHEIEYFGYSFD